MRIGGLATGIDTESIIRDMMNANRLPLNKVTQKKQYTEWQVANYRSINLDLDKYSSSLLNNMILSDQFRHKTVDVSSSDIYIKNLTSKSDLSGEVKVHQLAKNATLQSAEGIAKGDGQSTKSTLEDLGIANGDTMIRVNAPGMKEPVVLEFSKDDSLEKVLKDINDKTGVSAFYDSHTGKIAMTAKNSGEGNIELSGDLGDKLNADAAKEAGQNAEFTFNGLRTERTSNTFEISGFELTLRAVNETGITFSSAPDTDKIVDNVMKFVEDYNKLIETLNDKIREPKYRDFHPLSTEEKADMKEKEIELWEEKAMSGTLRNDPMISSMLSQMRTALMGSVGGDDGQTLKSIGITTTSKYLENGKLEVNEEALRKAITEDPDRVHQLFSADGDTVEEQGFARRLRSVVDATETKIKERAGTSSSTNDNFTIGRSLIDMDKQITRFEERLKMTEDRLWRQFTAMEVAIQKANAQSASLMNAFGGM